MSHKYADDMPLHPRPADRIATTPVPPDLQSYEGRWVAVRAGRIIASADDAPELAKRLREMGPDGRRARAQFVPPVANGLKVGLG